MPDAPFDVAKAHRWFAVELNNQAWDLVEAESRTAEQVDAMIHAAHAACYHWRQAGNPLNDQRALCLLANAYNVAGDYAAATRYARQCVELSGQNAEVETPFDRATAFECLARALACAGQTDEARQIKQLAREAAERIAEADDRQAFDRMLQSGEWHGVD